jgi:DNA repair exonuclease SbcCD ATPase subunit
MMSILPGLKARAGNYIANLQALRNLEVSTKNQLEAARRDTADHVTALQLLQYMAEKISAPNELTTAKLATLALRETFPDLSLSLEVEHSNLRGSPATTLKLRDADTGAFDDPIDAFGGGPASLLSLVLRVVTIVRQPHLAKVLILDEPMKDVSQEYKSRAAKLLKKLSDPPERGGLGFDILMVTHDASFVKEASTRYILSRTSDSKGVTLTVSDSPDDEED